ncbi:MAG TPA: methylenetetrahydrofolate--tRNA-(uracil(54)-C(5))-methyltransferase (FADH(2)-oxidizing) TrmFO [Myxococcota bacterium]|nr:methylenetetrahydrofolate--tRNA-(uracil(54)-C(5))-methyltransferase (FADH(2)-oxidizing) TrmFO [Myxococcota bacterium]
MAARADVVFVVGGGLAGCEAAWQLARRGIAVRLFEMRPELRSPAHATDELAELVCSNSLRSDDAENAVGLLHEELRRAGSLVLAAADANRVPAGSALAVDRLAFSREIGARIAGEPRIELVRREVRELPDGLAIVATGPLTSDALAARMRALCGDSLYFYDSIAPVVYADSLAHERLFRASRWQEPGAGEGDYLNSPLDRAAYQRFVAELLAADKVPLHDFEKPVYFEGCLPIEVMAERGPETLAFGPMKPVGLYDPRGGPPPYAVVQLRQEDKAGALYNLVGFQTKLRIGEQKRIFRTLPGLEAAVFARFGSVHRNTFIRAPELLDERLGLRARPGLHVAGQMAGVEGYVESAALGLLAGAFVAAKAAGAEAPLPPGTTALGALLRHLRESDPRRFQPANVTFGLFPPLEGRHAKVSRRERHKRLSARALEDLAPWLAAVGAQPT